MANQHNNFLPLLPVTSSSTTHANVVKSEDNVSSIHQLVQDEITLWRWCHARAEALRAKIPGLKAGSNPGTIALGRAVAEVERHILKAQQDFQSTVDKLSINERIILEKVDKAIGEQIRGDWLSMHPQFKNAGLPCPVCVYSSSLWINTELERIEWEAGGGYYYRSPLEPNDCMLDPGTEADQQACLDVGGQDWSRADESHAWRARRESNEDKVEGGSELLEKAQESKQAKSGKDHKQFWKKDGNQAAVKEEI